MGMSQLGTISLGRVNKLKIYESQRINQSLVEVSSSLLVQSIEKTVKKEGMKEEWIEEEIPETFTWTW